LRILEPGAHEVVLAVESPDARVHAADVELGQHLRAVEDGVALPEHDLVELGAGTTRRAARQRIVAGLARALLENVAVEPGVVGSGIEAQGAAGSPEADLDGACGL